LTVFAADGASFSINTDDPTVTYTTISDEYDLVRQWGLNEAHFIRAVKERLLFLGYYWLLFLVQNLEAAKHAFLPSADRAALRRRLLLAYGVGDDGGYAGDE